MRRVEAQPSRPHVSLGFELQVEDDWPPVAVEWLACEPVDDCFRLLVPPLFVRHLSVGDVLRVTKAPESEYVVSWSREHESRSTTVWLLRLDEPDPIPAALARLRALGCTTSSLPQFGSYSADVPPSVAIEDVDEVLGELDPSLAAVAFPSMRHPE